MPDKNELAHYQERCEVLTAKLADAEMKCQDILEELRDARNRINVLEAQLSMVELIFGGRSTR